MDAAKPGWSGALGLARLALLASPGLGGCFLAPKLVGVQPMTLDEARLEIETCALDGDRLSTLTREVLELHQLDGRLAEDPYGTLRSLHAQTLVAPDRPELFALAETSYWLGQRRGDRSAYLAGALYAYLYLVQGDGLPEPFDRRLRWASDIYSQGLLRFGSVRGSQRFEIAEGEYALPVGRIRITHDLTRLPELPREFLAADRFRIEGLSLRLRDSGMGVALIGMGAVSERRFRPGSRVRVQEQSLPATAFLRLHGELAALEGGLAATLEFHSGFDSASVEVNGKRLPLVTDRSAFLAHALDEPEVWRFSLKGLFASDAAESQNGLTLIQPYQPGRFPVVFVHGTASSPAYWADLFNTLWRDPELRRHAQFWFFKYATGSPIAYSAADLRASLSEAVALLDPQGTDTALRRMVLVGHSQGGLLVRMQVVKGSLGWVEEATGTPIEDFGFSPEERALLERCFDFEPHPAVARVVYLSTPHRGSFLAERWYSGLLAGLISLPKRVTDVGTQILQRTDAERVRGITSLEGMDPDSGSLARLLAAPTAPGVTSHSIISIGDADPDSPEELAKADDGVVAYESAHLEGVASEDLVPSGHSCQSHPVTIRALHRILREHLATIMPERGGP